uniref:Nascent polypeptide-associated complex subunit alpha-like UBA domain-containing protein n=1 Tax=viral metagenome TaxID=1070528 RepID=A0A6C0J2F5_9ZZZZ
MCRNTLTDKERVVEPVEERPPQTITIPRGGGGRAWIMEGVGIGWDYIPRDFEVVDDPPSPIIDENARDDFIDSQERTERTDAQVIRTGEQDIRIVMDQTGCTRTLAIRALQENDGDIVNAIMQMSIIEETIHNEMVQQLCSQFVTVPHAIVQNTLIAKGYVMDAAVADLRARYPFALAAIPPPDAEQIAMWNMQGMFREEREELIHVDSGYATD